MSDSVREDDFRWNFEVPVLGSLTPRERVKLGAVKLITPLYGEGLMRGFPLAFYAKNKTVVIPVMSYKFLRDIAVASAYLVENGFSLETVSDYASMLKYQVFTKGKKVPPPLEALHIPDNALNMPWVKNTSQKILVSSIVWIMSHELAHLYYQHPGYGPHISRYQAQQNEIEADRFANKIMRNISVAPIGIAEFFMVMSHLSVDRGDFENDDAWNEYRNFEATHPLTAERMNILANDLLSDPESFVWKEPNPADISTVIRETAVQIQEIAKILSNPEMQILINYRAKSITLDSLRPRRNIRPLQ